MLRDRLQNYLAGTGLTGPEFARRIGISRYTIWRILNGKSEPMPLVRRAIEGEMRKRPRGIRNASRGTI